MLLGFLQPSYGLMLSAFLFLQPYVTEIAREALGVYSFVKLKVAFIFEA